MISNEASKEVEERCRLLEDRLRILSEAMSAFAEATTDSQRLLDTVARRVAEVVKNSCIVLLLSDDGKTLAPAAMFDLDPEALREVREAFLQPFLVAEHPTSRQVLESGEPWFAPKLDLEHFRPPRNTPGFFDFMQRLRLHSLLIVALRVHDRGIGVIIIARHGEQSRAFDTHDLDLAQNLASHAALAISNSRLLAEARRERTEGRRIAERSSFLAEAAGAFATTTDDLDQLFTIVAHRLGELIGDMCVMSAVTEDGGWLEPMGDPYHRDPELLAATRELSRLGRQRVGEGLSGRAVTTGLALLTPVIDLSECVAASEPKSRAFLQRLGVTSSITLPFVCRGKVVAVANLLRGAAAPAYTEDDLAFARSVASHAALAIANARAYAAERQARDAAEEAMLAARESDVRFARLSQSGIIGIVVYDLSASVTEVNDAFLGMIGYSREEILSGSVPWKDLTPDEWEDVDAGAFRQLTTSGIVPQREKEYIRKDGSRVPVLIGTVMLEGGGTKCISFVLDLTERKKEQAAIEQMRRERAADVTFQALLEAAPDAMVVINKDDVIVLVNAQFETLFGYARAELVGKTTKVLVPERFRLAQRARHDRHFSEPMRPMPGMLDTAQRKDGTEFPIEVRLSPLYTETGLLLCGSIRDTTQRTKAEAHRAHLAALVDSSDEAIVGKTPAGVITSWNEGAHRMFGYTAAEILGESISTLVPAGYEEEERMILETVSKGESKRFDTLRQRKDGTHIDVSVTISPVRDSANRVVGISKVARDISDRKRAETALAMAKDAAESATRELEAFSYSVAHDLRAPLRGMSGFAQVLLDDYAEALGTEGRDCLQEIRSNAQRMDALIEALLSLSRVTGSDFRTERVDLSAMCRTIAERLAATEPQRTLSLVVQEGVYGSVDPALARALFDNLIGNAWKFTAHADTVRIEFGALRDKGNQTLFLRDNGAGFDMAYAAKLFAPFQRLHTVSEFPGTGIGLATAQRIIHRHGGRIWAEGKVGEGAVFYFTLPTDPKGCA